MEIEKTLKVQKRTEHGKGSAGRLRAKDMIPGVFYTKKGDNIMVEAPALPLQKIYESVGHTAVFNLEIESGKDSEIHPVLIWQIQRHPYKNQFLHIDYYGVDLDSEVKVDVPIEYTGVARGVKLGGVLETYRESVRLASKPLEMPQKVTIDVSNMNIGDTITVADLVLPPNVHAVFDKNYAIVSVLAKSKDSGEQLEGEPAAS